MVVRLPVAEPPPPRNERVTEPPRRPHRILLIEDNLDAAESLGAVLELEGHAVEIAHDGPEGIARARALRPDVVLCDIGLPDMDGYEVARTLRGDPSLREVLLVALTGYALPEDQGRAADAGFDVHLSKPPDIEQLRSAIARAPVRAPPG
jgi:two-component system CheB/CheR fusion protein